MLFLEGIHASGIFHADIKPEQMLEMPDGSTTVCDYGMMPNNNLARPAFFVECAAPEQPREVAIGAS